ncbi:MAG: right-handed parallel beta-helix repeat-containing protein [Epulopiscium sp.]|nr:right-handed parallel beta-helix repeat-containing protein [Candidatus Epulonipiscium sp.]
MKTFKVLEEKLSKLTIELPYAAVITNTDIKEVNAADFGIKAGKDICNTDAFARAIDYCRENKVNKLTIPKGIYYFKHCSEYAHLMLDNIEDLVVDGNGSEFIFETVNPYISIRNSNKVLVKDLVLDWNWDIAPLASVGVVSKIDEDGAYIECSFPEYEDISEDMKFSIVGPFDPARYTPGSKGGIEFRPYKNVNFRPSGDKETDEKMRELVRELSNVFLPKQEKVDKGVIRFYTVDKKFTKERFKKGDCFRFRHYEYDILTVPILDSKEITLDNITLYSSPGSGFVGNGDIEGLHFKGCKVTVRPGTVRNISTATDCLHVSNSQGKFIIEDCEFGYAGDDCINIHDNSSMGITVLDSHTLVAERVEKTAILFEVGYPVELRNPDLSPTGFSSKLTSVEYKPENRTCVLKFEDQLPDNLSKDTVLWNKRFETHDYIIRGCRFENNRARGILLQGSNGLVEDNIFENIQGAAIQIETGSEARWSEGHGVKNLIIRNNIIRHCDLNAWQMAVIYMGVYLPDGRTEEAIFENVLIEKNSIIDCPRLAMFLSSCKNVVVQDNVIVNANQIPLDDNNYGSSTMERPIYGETYKGTIQFEKSTDCVERNNKIYSTLI